MLLGKFDLSLQILKFYLIFNFEYFFDYCPTLNHDIIGPITQRLSMLQTRGYSHTHTHTFSVGVWVKSDTFSLKIEYTHTHIHTHTKSGAPSTLILTITHGRPPIVGHFSRVSFTQISIFFTQNIIMNVCLFCGDRGADSNKILVV